MYPDLIDIGFLHIKTYGALMATGFIVCWWLIERLSGRKDLSNLLMALMLGGVVGSRAAYVIEHWKAEFASNPMSVMFSISDLSNTSFAPVGSSMCT